MKPGRIWTIGAAGTGIQRLDESPPLLLLISWEPGGSTHIQNQLCTSVTVLLSKSHSPARSASSTSGMTPVSSELRYTGLAL